MSQFMFIPLPFPQTLSFYKQCLFLQPLFLHHFEGSMVTYEEDNAWEQSLCKQWDCGVEGISRMFANKIQASYS